MLGREFIMTTVDEGDWNITVPKQAHVPRIGNPIYNTNRDLAPYGVRDMVPGPVDRSQAEHRTELFDSPYSANKPPMPNWGNVTFPEDTDEARRFGSEYYKIIRDSQTLLSVGFRELGTFNVPHTGFTALRHIRPATTMAWL